MIKEYQINDEINYNNIKIKVTGFKINGIKGMYEPRILDVYFNVKNSTDKSVNIYEIINSLVLYQNYSNSVIQNMIEEGRPKNHKISYKSKDMLINAKEVKNFTLKYMIEDYDKGRNNFIYYR